jgi:hypothetical protein
MNVVHRPIVLSLHRMIRLQRSRRFFSFGPLPASPREASPQGAQWGRFFVGDEE